MKSQSKPSPPRKAATRARRPYHRPRLTTYGDVRRLTDTGSNMGLSDSAYGTKT